MKKKDMKKVISTVLLTQYLGDKCVCGHKFKKVEELENDIVWHPRKEGRISHKECYKKGLK